MGLPIKLTNKSEKVIWMLNPSLAWQLFANIGHTYVTVYLKWPPYLYLDINNINRSIFANNDVLQSIGNVRSI